MVRTDEFSLVRYDGDRAKADAVYAGVDEPLLAEDVADAIAWTLTRPHHVNVDSLIPAAAGPGLEHGGGAQEILRTGVHPVLPGHPAWRPAGGRARVRSVTPPAVARTCERT